MDSEFKETIEFTKKAPPTRECSACGKLVSSSLNFSLGQCAGLLEQVGIAESLGQYEPGVYVFCYECVLKRLGVKPKPPEKEK